MTKKETIDDFLTRRYTHLKSCTHQIMKKLKQRDQEDELLHLLVEHLYDKGINTDSIDMNRIEEYSVGWLKNTFNWKNDYIYNKQRAKYAIEFEDHHLGLEVEKNCNIDKEEPEDIKWLEDNFSDDRIEFIKNVRIYYNKLEPKEKILYDMYFTNDMTIREIAADIKVKVSMSQIRIELNKLKEKLKDKCLN